MDRRPAGWLRAADTALRTLRGASRDRARTDGARSRNEERAARPDLRRFRNAARILALQWTGRVQAGQVEHWHETAAPDRLDLFAPSLAR